MGDSPTEIRRTAGATPRWVFFIGLAIGSVVPPSAGLQLVTLTAARPESRMATTARVPLVEDEIGELASAFNLMALIEQHQHDIVEQSD